MVNSQLLMSSFDNRDHVLGNLEGCALAVEIAALKASDPRPVMVICSDPLVAARLDQELRWLCPHENIMNFRDYETLPYDMISPHQDIISSRIEFLARAPEIRGGIVITSINAVMQRLCPVEYIRSNSFIIARGDERDPLEVRETIISNGYNKVEQVLHHGDFAHHSDHIDIFPMGYDSPLRIDFFDNEVESIKTFDISSQRSTDGQKIKEIRILPANEFPLDEKGVIHFRSQYRDAFSHTHFSSQTVYKAISRGSIPAGIEYYLPLFFGGTATIFDYLTDRFNFILTGDFDRALHEYDLYLHQRAEMFRGNIDHPVLPVYDIFLSREELYENLKDRPRITLKQSALSCAEMGLPEPANDSKAQTESPSKDKAKAKTRVSKAKSAPPASDESADGLISAMDTAQLAAPQIDASDTPYAGELTDAADAPYASDLTDAADAPYAAASADADSAVSASTSKRKAPAKGKGKQAASAADVEALAAQAAAAEPAADTAAADGAVTDTDSAKEIIKPLFVSKAKDNFNAPCASVPEISLNHRDRNSSAGLAAFLKDFCGKKGGRVLISAISEGRRQSLRDLIPASVVQEFGMRGASNIKEFLESPDALMITVSPFDQGVLYDKAAALAALKSNNSSITTEKKARISAPHDGSDLRPVAFLTETELLGFKVVRQRRRNRRAEQIDQDTIIKNLSQLTEGQIVVHIDHGIGRYRGLKTEVINGIAGEYLTIEYRNGDMLSIPITSLNKVARYSGEENPELSRLGTDAWAKKKNKAAQRVRDVAAELLDVYAQRELRRGFAFKVDEHALEEFTASFPYEETDDQIQAIEQTIADMKKPVAMDRLICGDVGFGKTEVALRAAFIAAMNGKQVAVLAPTTILAEQHYENFKERFATTAITVDTLSRFRSAKQQQATINALKEGSLDIVIGTHTLLSQRVQFKDLGLLIIDEEHRFGVRQKERLKALRAEVDLLTLTATPIPRTLNMAMEGMRELSIIATPPAHRLAVKTFISPGSDTLCREAIMRELRRGGQVYYLHNDVSTIELKLEELNKLVPEAQIEIAHGQMEERRLQKVMQDFYNQRFNVLLCSTIVENGLDVPTANTIIINRADRLGLAQLHQIRGRVGRSHHQAYAYFFTPPTEYLAADAKRRLEAIASIDELGAGFVLASHDLEIRGAGELLGEEQSGQLLSIGFSLYMDMLNAAVTALKEGREPSLSELNLNECDIDLNISALLPESYIRDVNTRLSLYKRMAACQNDLDFDDLKIELIDRFGNLPPEAVNLLRISRLRRMATILGITKIGGDASGALITFSEHHKVDPAYMVSLVVKSKHNEYRIPRPDCLRYNLPETQTRSRIQTLEMVLRALYSHSSAASIGAALASPDKTTVNT